MGKVRQRFLGIEEIEEQQKQEQKERAERKKMETGDDVSVDESHEEAETAPKAKKAAATSSRGKKHGAKYEKALSQIDQSKQYEITEAVELVKKVSFAKFDESIELHLNVASEGLKGEVSLPHSTGRTVRVVVLDDAVMKEIEDGNINFDVLVAHPSQMPKIAKFARTLGPKGLMPNPKAGTVSTDPEGAAEKFKKGSIRWKSESKAPIIHQMIAKKSADTKEIVKNAQAFIDSVGLKNITSAFISASMTPSVKLKLQSE